MYKRIMVPLDGSELAECVLPHLKTIVRGCIEPVSVVLIRVIEPIEQHADDYAFLSEEQQQDVISAKQKNAKSYLEKISQLLAYEGIHNIVTVVALGKSAESIIDHAETNSVDLIIVATHGWSGISRWIRGSVADRILHSASFPVLMVRAS